MNDDDISSGNENKRTDSSHQGKRGWIKQYMHKIKPGVYQCVICCVCLKMPHGLYGNMKRHIKTKHPYIHAKETNNFNMDFDTDDNNEERKPTKIKSSVPLRQWIEKYMSKIKTGVYRCVVCYAYLKMPHGLYSNMKRHFVKKHPSIYKKETNILNTESCGNDNEKKILNINKRLSGQKSSGQQINEGGTDIFKDTESFEVTKGKEHYYVYLVEDLVAEQTENLNENVVDDSEITNFETQVENEIVLGPDGQLQTCDPDFEEKIKALCQKGPKGKRSYKTCIWNFFKHVHGNVHACLICDHSLSIFPESVASLKRHIMSRHKEVFDLILKYTPECDTSVHNIRNSSTVARCAT